MTDWLENTRLRTVGSEDPDLNDETYLVPHYGDLSPLATSIQQVGIINVPVLQEREDRSFRPVLGRRRLQAAKELAMTGIPVRVVSSEMPEAEGFLLALWDNIATRPLDIACRAFVVRRLLHLFPREVVASEFLPILGLPPHGPPLERANAIGGLDHSILRALAQGALLEKTALLMTEVDGSDRALLMDLIGTLGTNANKSAEIVESLADLSVYHRKPVAEYLNTREAREILLHEGLSRPQRAERFRELVRAWKNPGLVDKERLFGQWRDSLPSDPRITVRPSKAFEDERSIIEIRAESKEEVEGIFARLVETKDRG